MNASLSSGILPKKVFRSLPVPVPALVLGGGSIAICIAALAIYAALVHKPMLALAGMILSLMLFAVVAALLALLAYQQSRTMRAYTARIAAMQSEVEASRAEADKYIQAAAHDMQAPLRHVSGFVQLLTGLERFRGDPEMEKYSGYILDATRRMSDMVSGLVEWGRIDNAQISGGQVELGNVFRNAIASLNGEIAKAEGAVDIPDNLPSMTGSGLLLEKAVVQVLRNCVAYRSSGTPLRVRVAALSSQSGKGFRVEDNGIGVKPEHRETVFEPFKRLHSYDRINGTGLGLALARKIVEKHGGRMRLEDTSLGGVAVAVVFPP